MSRTALLSLVVAVGLAGVAGADDWPCYAHDPAHTGFSLERPGGKLKLLWDRSIGRSTAQPVVKGGRVCLGTWTGRFLCLDADDGRELWHFDVPNKIGFAAAIADGLVVFGSDDQAIYALDAGTGKLVWRKATGDKIWSAPSIVDRVVYIGSNDGNLYALDLASGREHWKHDCGSPVWSSPAVSEGAVYAASREGLLVALDARSGRRLWQYKTQGKISDGSPSVSQGVVCIGTLIQKDWPDGEGVEWYVREKLARMLVDEGRGYTFFALDAKSGAELWKWPSKTMPPQEMDWGGSRSWFWKLGQIAHFKGMAPSIADSVIYAQSMIYNHEHNSPVIAFDLKTGRVLWAEEFNRAWTGGHRLKNSLAITQDLIFGTSFIGRRDGTRLKSQPYGDCPAAAKLTGGYKAFDVYSPVLAEGKLFVTGIIPATPAMSLGGDNLRVFRLE